MTATRAKIEASLAERGRPVEWANEQQAAVLSGVSANAFRKKVKGWEASGFPQKNPENGKRPIRAILAFWRLPANHPTGPAMQQPDEDESEKETWHGHPGPERRAS